MLDALKAAGVKDTITVAGHGIDLLKEVVRDSRIVEQKELLGSGDAVSTARKALDNYSGDVLVICGDTPLVRSETIQAIIEKHKSSGADLTLLTAKLKDPMGYGRIIRDGDGAVQKIVEEENASLYEEVVNEVNVGTYCYKAEALFKALGEVKPDSRKQEIFLTDTVEIMHRDGRRIESVEVDDVEEMIGINSRKDLAEATQIDEDADPRRDHVRRSDDRGPRVNDDLSGRNDRPGQRHLSEYRNTVRRRDRCRLPHRSVREDQAACQARRRRRGRQFCRAGQDDGWRQDQK